jgi:hypothetical protein
VVLVAISNVQKDKLKNIFSIIEVYLSIPQYWKRFFKLIGFECPKEIANCSTGKKGIYKGEKFFQRQMAK